MHSENEVVYLYLDDIIPNRFQPREVFDERALKELALSIKEHGVIQPIIVRSIGQKYEIIAGERRYKASALAGLTKIPAIVRNLDDKESSKVALLENLQRRNLNAIEEARTYQKILELDQMTQESLAKTMGKSQSAVANKLRLLALSDEVQDALLKEQISERHARALLNIKDPKEQKELLEKIINTKMTVRELETEIKGEDGEIDSDLESDVDDSVDINNVSLPTALDDLIKINHGGIPKTNPNTDVSADLLSLKTPKFDEPLNNKDKDMDLFNIKPPEEQKEQEAPKFINYGEIDEDELNDDEQDEYNPPSYASTTVDLDEIKSNAIDINQSFTTTKDVDKKPDALDSLLNLKPAGMRIEEEESSTSSVPSENKFFNIQEEEKVPKKELVETTSLQDLFSVPNLIPSKEENSQSRLEKNNNLLDYEEMDKNLPLVSINEPDTKLEHTKDLVIQNSNENSIEFAVTSIQTTLKDLEKNGFKVEYDEMDLKNSYQMIIKIIKDESR